MNVDTTRSDHAVAIRMASSPTQRYFTRVVVEGVSGEPMRCPEWGVQVIRRATGPCGER